MPLAIIILSLVLIIAGIRGSYKDLASLLTADFTGEGNFLNWLAAIAIVGAVGYVPRLQHWSRMFIALIIIAIFLKNGNGLFDQLASALDGTSADAQHPNPVGTQSGTGTNAGGTTAGSFNPLSGQSNSIYSGVTGGGISGLPPDISKAIGNKTTSSNPVSGVADFIPGL